jgi:hypothetical protein
MYAGADVLEVEQLVEGADKRITKCQVLLFEFLDSKEQRPGIH